MLGVLTDTHIRVIDMSPRREGDIKGWGWGTWEDHGCYDYHYYPVLPEQSP